MSLPRDLLSKLEKLKLAPPPVMLVVSVGDQSMTLFRDGKPDRTFRVATSKFGAGQVEGTNRTPLGLHRVAKKIGAGAPPGTVFKSRVDTRRVWKAGEPGFEDQDLITSRILWLEGLEEGFNRGRDAEGRLVDSHDRYVYIHGTNHEDELGRPSSHGCVRMANTEVIALFDLVAEGALVWVE